MCIIKAAPSIWHLYFLSLRPSTRQNGTSLTLPDSDFDAIAVCSAQQQRTKYDLNNNGKSKKKKIIDFVVGGGGRQQQRQQQPNVHTN